MNRPNSADSTSAPRRRSVLGWLVAGLSFKPAPASVQLVQRGGWILRKSDLS